MFVILLNYIRSVCGELNSVSNTNFIPQGLNQNSNLKEEKQCLAENWINLLSKLYWQEENSVVKLLNEGVLALEIFFYVNWREFDKWFK